MDRFQIYRLSFREAFPRRCRDVGEYMAVQFPGAQIYVRKTKFNMLEGGAQRQLDPWGPSHRSLSE